MLCGRISDTGVYSFCCRRIDDDDDNDDYDQNHIPTTMGDDDLDVKNWRTNKINNHDMAKNHGQTLNSPTTVSSSSSLDFALPR